MLAGRGIENKIRRRNFARVADCLERVVSVSVEIEVYGPDILYIGFGTGSGLVLEGIHPQKDIGARPVLARKASLEFGARYRVGPGDSLNRPARRAIMHYNRYVFGRVEQIQNVLRSGKKSGL